MLSSLQPLKNKRGSLIYLTRRSTTGYLFMLGYSIVAWCSKHQPTEYRAATATMATQESMWLVQLLRGLNQDIDYYSSYTPLLCDNLSSIQIAENPTFPPRIKHIKAHYQFIHEKVLKDDIDLNFSSMLKPRSKLHIHSQSVWQARSWYNSVMLWE